MRSLPRRTVLRGLGASLALPMLDAMVPALGRVARAAARPVHRFQAFYVPNGMAMQYWLPKTEGRDFELTSILEPLAAFRQQMLVLSGLNSSWTYIHAGASGSFLTGTARGGRNEVEIIADVSMDQLLARQFATETQLASLETALDGPANAGACTGILSCAYTHTISWRSATQPLPMEHNPRAVFERLFGAGEIERDPVKRARTERYQKSVLDSVLQDAKRLERGSFMSLSNLEHFEITEAELDQLISGSLIRRRIFGTEALTLSRGNLNINSNAAGGSGNERGSFAGVHEVAPSPSARSDS